MKTKILFLAFIALICFQSIHAQVNISLDLDQETTPMSQDLVGSFSKILITPRMEVCMPNWFKTVPLNIMSWMAIPVWGH